jgi:hypothetical protein
VLALDVTKTFGVIALIGWEVNLTTIVALLTLIGYSVNDKVVVCDRIREHLRGGPDGDFADVIDRSLNQVLARCIFTSGTTLAALLPMAIWGGPAVAGFRLADDRGRGDRHGVVALRVRAGAGMARRTGRRGGGRRRSRHRLRRGLRLRQGRDLSGACPDRRLIPAVPTGDCTPARIFGPRGFPTTEFPAISGSWISFWSQP